MFSRPATSTRSVREHEHDLTTEYLSGCIGHTSIDRDLRYLDDRGEDVVPGREQIRAHFLVQNHAFHHWLSGHGLPHLLVHGGYDEASHVSGLSLFCVYLKNVLAWYNPHFVTLAFFCGMNTGQQSFAREWPPGYNDTQLGLNAVTMAPSYDEAQLIRGDDVIMPQIYDQYIQSPRYSRTQLPSTGGSALIRSFILQILRHLPGQRISVRGRNRRDIERGNLHSLCHLFLRLVGMLPPHFTVWCLVDGAEYYEQDGFWADARLVINHLVQLSTSQNTGASVRLLITTPTFTSRILDWFEYPQPLPLERRDWEDLVPDSEGLQGELNFIIEQSRPFRNY